MTVMKSVGTGPRLGTARYRNVTRPLSDEHPQLSTILPFLRLEVGQNIALHASPTASHSSCLQISGYLLLLPKFPFLQTVCDEQLIRFSLVTGLTVALI